MNPEYFLCDECNKKVFNMHGESPICDECYEKQRDKIVECSICCKIFEKSNPCFKEDISRHTIQHELTYTVQGRTPDYV
tara:strand:- start:3231 stop:3467 length:237 start_codon:yes stop_codon:yes gene_type:complete